MDILPFVFVAIVMLVMVVFMAVIARFFRLWLQCFLSGAGVPFPQIVAMQLRRSPARKICELRIKLQQNGIPVSATQLERAHLQGADIEKLAETMLHAHRTDRDVTWEQLVETDLGGQT